MLTPTGPAPTSPAHPATAPAQLSNEQIIYNWLTGVEHLTSAQASGVLGNLQVESNFSPTAYNANEGALGIAQWEGGRGPIGGLGSYAAAHPTLGGIDTLGTDLGYLGQELSGPYSTALAQVRATTTPGQAAQAWSQYFEGNNPSSNPTRVQDANAIYGQVQGGKPLTGGPSSSPAAAGLASFQTGNNGFGGQLPGGPWDPLNWPGDAVGAVGNAAGSVASGIAQEVEQWSEKIFHALFTFLVNALCVVVGLICLYQGYKLATDAEEGDTGAGPAANPTSASDNTEKEVAKEESGGGGGGAEEAAVAE